MLTCVNIEESCHIIHVLFNIKFLSNVYLEPKMIKTNIRYLCKWI